METNNSDSRYLKAKSRIDKIKRFYGKVFRGMIAIIVVAAINYYFNEWENPWFLWVVFAVGLRIFVKAIKVFGFETIFGQNWEERKIKELMDKQDS